MKIKWEVTETLEISVQEGGSCGSKEIKTGEICHITKIEPHTRTWIVDPSDWFDIHFKDGSLAKCVDKRVFSIIDDTPRIIIHIKEGLVQQVDIPEDSNIIVETRDYYDNSNIDADKRDEYEGEFTFNEWK